MHEAARLRDDTISDLRRRLDAEAEQRRRLTAILADQRAAPAPIRRWWRIRAVASRPRVSLLSPARAGMPGYTAPAGGSGSHNQRPRSVPACGWS